MVIKFRIREEGEYHLDDASYVQLHPLEEGVLATSLTIRLGDVVELYTGIKDRHGVEIYEGDIVKIYDSVYEVKIGEWCGTDYYDCPTYGPYADNGKEQHALPFSNIKIIGNTFENQYMEEFIMEPTIADKIFGALDGGGYETGALEAVQNSATKTSQALANLIELLVDKGVIDQMGVEDIMRNNWDF